MMWRADVGCDTSATGGTLQRHTSREATLRQHIRTAVDHRSNQQDRRNKETFSYGGFGECALSNENRYSGLPSCLPMCTRIMKIGVLSVSPSHLPSLSHTLHHERVSHMVRRTTKSTAFGESRVAWVKRRLSQMIRPNALRDIMQSRRSPYLALEDHLVLGQEKWENRKTSGCPPRLLVA